MKTEKNNCEVNMLAGCRRGNEDSWKQLFTSYYPLAKWVVCHTIFQPDTQLMNHLAQDAMVAVVENIDRITDEDHLKRFVKQAARNKCIDYIRRNRMVFTDIPDNIIDETEKDIDEHVLSELHEALDALQEPCNSIVRARFLEGLSYRDVAKKAGVEYAQIGMKISRCLTVIKNFLLKRGISWRDIL